MDVQRFTEEIESIGIRTLIGVPDSTLKEFCDYMQNSGQEKFQHYVPANEGAAVGMAAGVYLSTGCPACVYMQNSGLGNAVNPISSLMNEEVYDIPALFLIGYRGEPGMADEPQHKFMGAITEELLEVLHIKYRVICKETTEEELKTIFIEAKKQLAQKKQFAVVVKKGTFLKEDFPQNRNQFCLVREDVIKKVLSYMKEEDMIFSTTGKISRELYEQSDQVLGQHQQAFLTVGGMGHASMIALGAAKCSPDKSVYCIDGDGAVLMHMGSLAFIGKQAPANLIHICLNNDAHESVGGMPTGAVGQNYAAVALACGYKNAEVIEDEKELNEVLEKIHTLEGPIFVEIRVSLTARANLGRPKEQAVINKKKFMEYHGVTE